MQLNSHKCARFPPKKCKVSIRNVTVSWLQDKWKCSHCSAIQRSHTQNTTKTHSCIKINISNAASPSSAWSHAYFFLYSVRNHCCSSYQVSKYGMFLVTMSFGSLKIVYPSRMASGKLMSCWLAHIYQFPRNLLPPSTGQKLEAETW